MAESILTSKLVNTVLDQSLVKAQRVIDLLELMKDNEELRRGIIKRARLLQEILHEETFPAPTCQLYLNDLQDHLQNCEHLIENPSIVNQFIQANDDNARLVKLQEEMNQAVSLAILAGNCSIKYTLEREFIRVRRNSSNRDDGVFIGSQSDIPLPLSSQAVKACADGELLRVTWKDDRNTPANVTDYEVEYDQTHELTVRVDKSKFEQANGNFQVTLGKSKVDPGGVYSIRVRAVNGHGPGKWTEPIVCALPQPPPMPSTPAILPGSVHMEAEDRNSRIVNVVFLVTKPKEEENVTSCIVEVNPPRPSNPPDPGMAPILEESEPILLSSSAPPEVATLRTAGRSSSSLPPGVPSFMTVTEEVHGTSEEPQPTDSSLFGPQPPTGGPEISERSETSSVSSSEFIDAASPMSETAQEHGNLEEPGGSHTLPYSESRDESAEERLDSESLQSQPQVVQRFKWESEVHDIADLQPDGISLCITLSGFSKGTRYSFRIAMKNEHEVTSRPSTIVTLPAGELLPGPPTNVCITDYSHNTVALKWDAPTFNSWAIHSYQVQKRARTGQWDETDSTGQQLGTKRRTISGLHSQTEYYFRVCGVTESGHEGSYSDDVRRKTKSHPFRRGVKAASIMVPTILFAPAAVPFAHVVLGLTQVDQSYTHQNDRTLAAFYAAATTLSIPFIFVLSPILGPAYGYALAERVYDEEDES